MIKEYHADNGVFASYAFKENYASLNQKYSFSGVGAHHQSRIAEQNIKTVAQWAHANKLHFAHHWPAQANVRFWPQAIDYALWVFNCLPNLVNGSSPNKIWSSCRAPTEEFNWSHVFGCPVYVLDATLQDGHKIPKWLPRARLGVFLGFSTLHSSQVPIVMNVDTGKIFPQFHVIFDDKFETVMSMTSEDSIGDQWKLIFCLKRESFEDVDYDEAGHAILPPLTSIFQQNDLVNDIVPTSPWTLAPKNFTSPVAPHPLCSDSNVDQAASGDIVPDGIPNSGSPFNTDSEGATKQKDSAPEGASLETLVHLDHSTTTVIPEGPVNNGLSASGWPLCNVGDNKQGPAKIRHLPIDGEQYDFSFSVISEWDRPVPIIANCANVQTKYHLQHLQKSFLAECYLLQDCWTDDPECLHQIYSNVILDSWKSNDIYIMDIQDPHLLAAHSSASKYNEDNPSWYTATKGPFQAEFWKAMHVELNTLVNEFKCWDLVPRLPHMHVLPSTWAFKIKQFPDGTIKKFKVRFCARGDHQKKGIDFFETWAPVVQWSTIQIVMVLAAKLGLQSVQCDITAAFIHGHVPPEEEIYVRQPRGFKQEEGDKVLCL